jgi:hypothetical protein
MPRNPAGVRHPAASTVGRDALEEVALTGCRGLATSWTSFLIWTFPRGCSSLEALQTERMAENVSACIRLGSEMQADLRMTRRALALKFNSYARLLTLQPFLDFVLVFEKILKYFGLFSLLTEHWKWTCNLEEKVVHYKRKVWCV